MVNISSIDHSVYSQQWRMNLWYACPAEGVGAGGSLRKMLSGKVWCRAELKGMVVHQST